MSATVLIGVFLLIGWLIGSAALIITTLVMIIKHKPWGGLMSVTYAWASVPVLLALLLGGL